ncbi:MAG: FecR domain-containing protein [Candidatus Omnitrophica bacterium]|nr:FecR domain-containing protein [Candidatus Omnitrophota bacterium]
MKKLTVITLAVLVVFAATSCFAAETVRQAKVMSTSGDTMLKKAGESLWLPAKTDMIVNQGDTIKTAKGSSAILNLGGAGNVEVKENSQLSVARLVQDADTGDKKTLLDLAMGEVFIKAEKLRNKEEKFEVKTPTSIVGVRGTKFSVKVEAVK